MINEAIHILNHQQPDQHFVQTLVEASNQHPYASALRVLLARASHLTGDARFDDDVRAAAIRTHNRKQLHDFVYTPLLEAKEMKPVLEEVSEMVPEEALEEEPIMVSTEIADETLSENTEPAAAKGTSEEAPTVEKASAIEETETVANESVSEKEEEKEESHAAEKPSNKFNLDHARIEVLEKQFLTEALASGAAIELMGESSDEDNAMNYAGNLRDRNQSETAQKKEIPAEEKPKAPKPTPQKLSLSGWLNLLETEEIDTNNSESTSKNETVAETVNENQSEKETSTKNTVLSEKSTEGTQSIKQAADIISNFIQNEDQIVPKRAEFFSPAKVAKNSLKDKDDLVTETLANIYAAQGNIQKAISIYEKLSLLHPEKSTYFAALIQKLKRQL